jgi:hypothetical protein
MSAKLAFDELKLVGEQRGYLNQATRRLVANTLSGGGVAEHASGERGFQSDAFLGLIAGRRKFQKLLKLMVATFTDVKVFAPQAA